MSILFKIILHHSQTLMDCYHGLYLYKIDQKALNFKQRISWTMMFKFMIIGSYGTSYPLLVMSHAEPVNVDFIGRYGRMEN